MDTRLRDTKVNASAPACAFTGPASTAGTEWFIYMATSAQQVSISTCGNASFDTRISVFTGANCNSLTCVAMNDDSPRCSAGSSQATFNTVTGSSYWIAVSGAGTQSGAYTLSVICGPICAPPANDVCLDATGITNALADGTGTAAAYTNVCATGDAPTMLRHHAGARRVVHLQ